MKNKLLSYTTGIDDNNQMWIECKVCDRKSYNDHDIRQLYCGKCHVYHNVREFPPLIENDICPECESAAVWQCSCPVIHRKCDQGHKWFWFMGEKRQDMDGIDLKDEKTMRTLREMYGDGMDRLTEALRENPMANASLHFMSEGPGDPPIDIPDFIKGIFEKGGIEASDIEEVSKAEAFNTMQARWKSLQAQITHDAMRLNASPDEHDFSKLLFGAMIALQNAQGDFISFLTAEVILVNSALDKIVKLLGGEEETKESDGE